MSSHAATSLLARMLLSSVFLVSGLPKLMAYSQSQTYLQSLGVPGQVLPVIIALEVGCGLMILVGVLTRTAAFLLACLAVATAVVFHRNIGEDAELIAFMQNIAIAGGLLLLVANGPGAWAVMGRSGPRSEAPPAPKKALAPTKPAAPVVKLQRRMP